MSSSSSVSASKPTSSQLATVRSLTLIDHSQQHRGSTITMMIDRVGDGGEDEVVVHRVNRPRRRCSPGMNATEVGTALFADQCTIGHGQNRGCPAVHDGGAEAAHDPDAEVRFRQRLQVVEGFRSSRSRHRSQNRRSQHPPESDPINTYRTTITRPFNASSSGGDT